MKSHLTVIIFLFFFFAGYAVLGYTRHHIYESEINKSVEKWVTARNEGIEKPMSWEKFPYLGAPEAVPVIEDPLFRELMYSFYDMQLAYAAEYQIELVPHLIEDISGEKWNLWDAYTTWAAFKVLRLDTYVGCNTWINLGPISSTDICGSLAESIASWELAGGKCEGNWMEVYEQSSEYKEWLGHYFADVSGPKKYYQLEMDDETEKMIDELIREALAGGKSKDDPYVQFLYKAKEQSESDSHKDEWVHEPMTIEERYHTTKGQELPFWTDLFFGHILEPEQRLMETSFERYVIHFGEGDIVKTTMDAGVIETVGDYLTTLERNDYNFSYVFNYCAFPLKDLITDGCVLILVSVVSTILMVKWVLPRFISPKQEDQTEK